MRQIINMYHLRRNTYDICMNRKMDSRWDAIPYGLFKVITFSISDFIGDKRIKSNVWNGKWLFLNYKKNLHRQKITSYPNSSTITSQIVMLSDVDSTPIGTSVP